jgi:hypothetical protein
MKSDSEIKSIILDFSNKSKKSKSDVKKIWEKSIKLAEEFYGIKEEDFEDEEYEYARDVMKNLLGIKENITMKYIKSGKTLKEFIEDIASDGIANSSVNADKSLGKEMIVNHSKDKKVNEDDIVDVGNVIDKDESLKENKDLKINLYYNKEGSEVYGFKDKSGKLVTFKPDKKELVRKDLRSKGFNPKFIDE